MKEEDKVEMESLKDLEIIESEADIHGVTLILIGGYAVRSYTLGYRYTKDMDFIIKREQIGALFNFLKGLGYDIEMKEFMIAGKKSINGEYIDLHISAGDVFDMSTKKTYTITEEVINDASIREVSGYYPRGRDVKVNAKTVCLEDLLILKLMPVGRERDFVDVVSLILDQRDNIDLEKFKDRCSKAELSEHILINIQGMIKQIKYEDHKNEKFEKIWLNRTGNNLLGKDKLFLIKKLKEFAKMLK